MIVGVAKRGIAASSCDTPVLKAPCGSLARTATLFSRTGHGARRAGPRRTACGAEVDSGHTERAKPPIQS